MAESRCENCRWWDNSTELASAQPGTTGACRVMAPVADDRSGRARWPYTEDTDWCGSFVAAPHEPQPRELEATPGRRAGGLARAAALSPERRAEIAKNAPHARWGGTPHTQGDIACSAERKREGGR